MANVPTTQDIFVQVKNDVTSDVLIKEGNKILDNVRTFNSLQLISNQSSQYVHAFRRLMLKPKLIQISGQGLSKQESFLFNWILHNLTKIIDLLKENTYTTKRTLYYTNKDLFKNSQRNADGTLDYIALLLNCSRDCLPVCANDRGKVVGNLQFRYKGSVIDCTQTDFFGHSTPILVDEITNIRSDGALFILLVESIVILPALHSAEFEKMHPCILVTGAGMPDISSRKFLRKISLVLNLHVLALLDGDIYGFRILTTYMYRSTRMAYDSENLTTPNIYWLGVKPSDSKKYDLRDEFIKSLTKRELGYLNCMMKKPFLNNHPNWIKELEVMMESKSKIDILATTKTNVNWLAKTYFPSKLNFDPEIPSKVSEEI